MRLLFATSALIALAMAASSPAAAADRGPRDLAGVWWTDAYAPRLTPADGKPIPFTAAGRKAYAKTGAGLKSGAVVDQADFYCVPEGMPRALASAYPMQIMMAPGQVAFAHEANRAYRIVAFTDKHQDPAVWDPSYMGDGIAKWDGDTLVIDSANFKADQIYLDRTGLPASEDLQLTEHIRLLDGGDRLEDVITITDPVNFTRPWTVSMTFKRRDDIQLKTDWVCGEPHRDVSGITGAAK